jgi:hypothetical protein
MRRLFRFLCASALATFALTACAFDPSADDTDESAAELSPEWFAQNLPEGSPLARAVLAVANDRDLSVDEYVRKVHITREAALAITNYRDGDELTDPSDDQRFDSLAELDALPFTNAAFWSAMIAYASIDAGPRPDGGVWTDGGIRPDGGASDGGIVVRPDGGTSSDGGVVVRPDGGISDAGPRDSGHF